MAEGYIDRKLDAGNKCLQILKEHNNHDNPRSIDSLACFDHCPRAAYCIFHWLTIPLVNISGSDTPFT